MHADGGPHNLALISLCVGKVAEHLQGGWVATGCHAHISLFARDERPYMGEDWPQQCNICKRVLFEHKLHHGPLTSAKLQGMEREDRDLAVIEILQDDSSIDLLHIPCKLREAFQGAPFPTFHLTIRAVRLWTESLNID